MSKADEMYSEEELKAIERLDRLTIGSIIQTTDIENASTIMYDKIILLNLINKQQKKIENSVSKDKIREKQILREFELQQEYKEFKEDTEWNRYNELLEE